MEGSNCNYNERIGLNTNKLGAENWDLIKNLPIELRNKIFSYQSVQDLSNTECVCRDWRTNRDFFGQFIFKIFEQKLDILDESDLCKELPSLIEKINSDSEKGQEALFQLARLYAKRDALTILYNIQDFRLKDQRALIEIAKICAQKELSAFARCIKNFGIKDQEALIDILRPCAERSPRALAECIKHFGIKDQKILNEIAKLCVQNAPNYALKFIKNFGIADQQGLIDIAKICAQKNAEETIANIKNFKIIDQQGLIDIAKICAQKNAEETILNIKNFRINDQQGLIDIAKICAQKNAEETILNIKNFRINDQQGLIDIAKICAQNSALFTVVKIKKFKINDQQGLIDIAKVCAQNNPMVTAVQIKNFGIKDQRALIDIAKLCFVADQCGLMTIEYIQNFCIETKASIEIIDNCLAELCAKNKWEIPYVENFLKDLKVKIAKRDLYVQKQIVAWAVQILSDLKEASPEKILFLNPILKNLADYRSPHMRELLSNLVVEFNQNDMIEQVQQEMIDHHNGKKNSNKTNHYNNQKALIAFLLSALISTNNDQLIENQRICNDFFKLFYLYDDSHQGTHQRTIVEMLYYFHQDEDLSLNEKMQILTIFLEGLRHRNSEDKKQKRIQFRNVMKSAQITKDLIQLGHGYKLKGIKGSKEIGLQLEELYKTELQIEMENFMEQYSRTIEKWRNTQAIWSYYATQKEDEENAQFFRTFVQSVLDESFKTMRYKNDPHLMHIFQTYPEIVDMWKKGEKAEAQEFSFAPALNQPMLSAKKIFKELKRCIQEKHLGELVEVKTNYPYLFDYLFGETENKSNYYLKIIRQKLNEAQKNKEHHLIKNLTFQIQFLQLEHIQDKDAVAKLKALLQNYENEKNKQFKQDIQDRLDRLTNEEIGFSTIQDWTVEDTDDPCDLLLLGTDVIQSCQCIDGDSHLNRGILGYLLNGKNRAIVVKDREGNIIGRRLLRLLWDPKEEKPVLFQEPYYFAIEDKRVKTLVDEMCKRRARSLGLPLLEKKEDVEQESDSDPFAMEYPNPIHSLGGQCPIEYVDALQGVSEDSEYDIEDCRIIA